MSDRIRKIGVVGAGTMGRGIAQLFVQCGYHVRLHDLSAEATAEARSFISAMLHRRAEKGEPIAGGAEAALARLTPVRDLAELADADLIIEAVAERLEVKQELFRRLEELLCERAILATNTSSLMVTAIAAGCRRAERVVGLHFFNPVPLMKLVEVIPGEQTDPSLVERLSDLTRSVGHEPIVSSDTPGFVVNHAGRALYTEGLQLLQDRVAPAAAIDTLMREMAGFRMGPFELFDLTGIDVSGSVVESIHAQYFFDPRYRSSPIVRRRVAAGLYGRKTGAGFYAYDGQKISRPEDPPVPEATLPKRVFIDGNPPELSALVERLGAQRDQTAAPGSDSLIVVAPIGCDCAAICAEKGYDPAQTVGIESFFGYALERRCLVAPVGADARMVASAHRLFSSDGAKVTLCNDSIALVAQRIVAVIVNLGCEIAQQRIAHPEDIDKAVRIGLGYPAGPLQMGDRHGPRRVLAVLEGLHALTGDPRYRPSGWLRRRAHLGLSLLTPDAL